MTLIVRSCRKHPDHFEIGTEFEKTLPWIQAAVRVSSAK